MRGAVLAMVVWLGWAGTAAAEPSLQIRLDPRRLGLEDLARLTVSIVDGGRTGEAPHLGELHNFEIVAGPSTETQFSLINGVATTSLSFVYVLQPTEVGAARIAPITVEVAGITLTSEEITAEVVPGSLAPPRRGPRWPQALNPLSTSDPAADQVARRRPLPPRIVLRQLIDADTLVQGQAVVADVVLDTTVIGIEGFEWVDQPSYPGWWAQRVELPSEAPRQLVEVDGAPHYRYTVARHVLVPLKVGNLAIPSATARIGVRSRNVFDPHQVVERSSDEVTVPVSRLPQAPSGYTGAVGDLRYRVRLTPQIVALGESAVLEVTLTGRGNLPLVEPPASWPECAGCDSYPPEEEDGVVVDSEGISGSRTWRRTLVPRQAGELMLQAVSLATFDPRANHYRSHAIGPVKLVVTAPRPAPVPAVSVPRGQEAELAAPPGEGPNGTSGSGVGSPTWIWMVAALAVGVAGGGLASWLIQRRRGSLVPRSHSGQSPAERARELQAVLEQWWLERPAGARTEDLARTVEELRRALGAVRFAPGRADHSETVRGLENRLRRVIHGRE